MVVRLHLVVGIFFKKHEQQWPRFDTQLITVKEQNVVVEMENGEVKA